MSDPVTKSKKSKLKDAKQRLAPDIAVGKPRPKKHGTVIVECRGTGGHVSTFFDAKWRKWKAYGTDEIAQQAMDGLARKFTFVEFRIKPDESNL